MSSYALVVEDDHSVASSMADVLRQTGFRVLLAANGQEALVLLEQHGAPSFVVTDLQMPMMDGFQLAAAIKADERWHGVPVIAMLGALRSLPAEGMALFSGFIGKPFRGDVLLGALPQPGNNPSASGS